MLGRRDLGECRATAKRQSVSLDGSSESDLKLELYNWMPLMDELYSTHLPFWYFLGNGTPLQYSCLENPMDGGAWWAAIYGVAQSQK